MNNGVRWVLFLVIGIVLGFMVSLLFNNGSDVASTEQPAPVVEEEASSEEQTADTEATETEPADTGTSAIADNVDNILVQKGCITCHDVSPLGIKGNGTGPDLAIAYDDVNNRFGKSLEEFLEDPEGTMSAVFSQTPLTDEEKQAVISLLKEYNEM